MAQTYTELKTHIKCFLEAYLNGTAKDVDALLGDVTLNKTLTGYNGEDLSLEDAGIIIDKLDNALIGQSLHLNNYEDKDSSVGMTRIWGDQYYELEEVLMGC